MNTFSLVDNGRGPAAAGLPSRRPRQLLVEDQPAGTQSLYQVFAPDHDVFMATGGEQALAACAGEQSDLALLDVAIPGTDGHHFCRRLKADAATRDIPVIFVSAQTGAAEQALSFELDCLCRPDSANAPGEAFFALPSSRKDRTLTRRFAST